MSGLSSHLYEMRYFLLARRTFFRTRTLTLMEQYLISLNFQAGTLPVPLAEQPKVSPRPPWSAFGRICTSVAARSQGEVQAGSLTHCSGANRFQCGWLSLLSAIPGWFISIKPFKRMEIKLYLGQKHILSKNTYYI